MSDYVVLARRYRPQSFDELVGQQSIKKTLKNAVLQGKLAHAYLFVGTRGTGKTSTARILAKALNCESSVEKRPCNTCATCKAITDGIHPDILEIDAASNRGVDNIRELKELVYNQPQLSPYKVYIIDEVHMLTKEAFNALLKTLEEPPPHVKFVLCTTEIEKVPITIRSRCQRHEFKPASVEEVGESLAIILDKEGVQFERSVPDMLARRSGGSLRDSQSLLDTLLAFGENPLTLVEAMRILGVSKETSLLDIVTALNARDLAAALTIADSALSEGADVANFTQQLLFAYRDLMIAHLGAKVAFVEFPSNLRAQVIELAQKRSLEEIIVAQEHIEHCLNKMRTSSSPRLLLELAISRVCGASTAQEVVLTSAPPTPIISAQPVPTHPFLEKIKELFTSNIKRERS